MPERSPLRSAALHLAGLWAIAVVQPVLDVIGRAPVFLVANRATPADIVLGLALLLFVPPLLMAALVTAAGVLHVRGRELMLGALMAVLVALVGVQALKTLGVTTALEAMPPAMLAGIAVAVLYFRYDACRSFSSVLGVAVLVVPLVFVQRPGIGRLIMPEQEKFLPADPADPDFRPYPVVLVVFDELPLASLLDSHGAIDPDAYPHVSALARDGIWFRNATAVSDFTELAVPPILTGRYPRPGELPTHRHHPDTLFTFLRRTHRLHTVEAATELMPRDETGSGLAAHLSRLGGDLAMIAASVLLPADLHARLGLPDVTVQWARFGSGDDARAGRPRAHGWAQRRGSVLEFIDAIDGVEGRPAFYYLHSLLPHNPWVFVPTGQRSSTRVPFPAFSRLTSADDEWAIAQLQQRHLQQVAFVDNLVGRLVARLRTTGLYDRTLLIVTADHGVAFTRGHNQRRFAPETAAEILRIPLIVKLPKDLPDRGPATRVVSGGQRVSDRNVETIDVAPTIAYGLGLALPWPVDGVPMLDPAAPPREEKRMVPLNGSGPVRFTAEGPALEPVLERRLKRFGSGSRWQVPRHPRFSGLVGRPVTDLPVAPSSLITDVAFAPLYERVDPSADMVPFDVSGRLLDNGGGDGSAVAVAVNGTIQAVTRLWPAGSGRWLATPPPDSWRRGVNAVDVFVVEGTEQQPRLAYVSRHTDRPPELNLISEEAALYWNVRQRGFRSHERDGDRRFRWTRGDGAVTVPLHGMRPGAVRLRIARAIVPAARLDVTANDCTLYTGTLPRQEWEVTFPLAACALEGDELTIRITSDAMRPRSGTDRRTLGVAVLEIVLLEGEREPGSPK